MDSSPFKHRDLRLILLGLVWIGLGSGVYIWGRPADSLVWGWLLPEFPHTIGKSLDFGILGHWLPTFSHVLAWSLITTGVLSVRSKTSLAAVCLLWLAINSLFELGQHHAFNMGEIIPDWPSLTPVATLIRDYFKAGTYDTGDLIAAVVGAGIAYVYLTGSLERNAIWRGFFKSADTL